MMDQTTEVKSTHSSTTMTQEKPFIDIRDLTVKFTGGRITDCP